MKSFNHVLSESLSRYASRQYQTPLLLFSASTFHTLLSKKRDFIIVPIHSHIEINKNLVIAPSTVKGQDMLATDYGSVFAVVDVLRNYEDEVKGLVPGYMIVTVEQLFMLDEAIINGTRQRILN